MPRKAKAQTDQVEITTGETDFPYTYSQPGKTPLESLFSTTLDPVVLEQMYSRYQLAKRIVDTPVEESLAQGFALKKFKVGEPGQLDADWIKNAMSIYENKKVKIIRHLKQTRLKGFSFLIFGYDDDPEFWIQPPIPGTKIKWVEPIPNQYITEIKTTDTFPQEIQYIQVTFGQTNYTLHPSRFIYCVNPKLTDIAVTGESALSPIYNLLNVQLHADWAIGQQLWRNAGGLLGIMAPKRTVEAVEKANAMASLQNVNARTVVYIPYGWNVKELLKKAGNLAVNRTYRVILEQIAAGAGIPVSMLIGSQRGALAPGEDDRETYYRLLGTIQENTEEPQLHAFLRKYQEAGELEPGDFAIQFNSPELLTPYDKSLQDTQLFAMSELKKRLEGNPAQFSQEELIKIAQIQRRKY